MRQGWERAGCTYCSRQHGEGTQCVCQQLSLKTIFFLWKRLWQITYRQDLLDRIKLVTIKLSESHCLWLGEKYRGNWESGARREWEKGAGGWRSDGQYTNPLCQSWTGRVDNRIFPKISAGSTEPLGAAYLIWWITHPLEPLTEICCCVYSARVAFTLAAECSTSCWQEPQYFDNFALLDNIFLFLYYPLFLQ